MRGVCIALLLTTSAAWGQTVQVRTGEHPGFTRIALDLPRGQDWRLGRVEGGYGLEIDGIDPDTSRSFRMIGRQRLARLQAEPGSLTLGIDCACYAEAFTTSRGTLVIDIRRGTPPAESQFEHPLLAEALPEPSPPPAVLPAYEWHELPRQPAALAQSTIDPLRDALLRKLADGAARGVVDIVDKIPEMPDRPDPPSQIRVAEAPGFLPDPAVPSTAEGRACIADTRVAIAEWGGTLPPAQEIAQARAGLVGEFDQPDAEALGRAIRYYLHLGFGAEARQLARTYPIDAGDRALWEAMANIIDGAAQTTGVLDTMASCDSDVALWGILAAAAPTIGTPEQTDAALRAFESLPTHMRQHLGPLLSERFAARHDANAALMVRESVRRGETVPTAKTRLMAALADQTEDQLLTLVVEGGTQSGEALIALADRRLGAWHALDQGMVTALAALRHERSGTGDEARVARLHLLGMASMGDYAGAFSALRNTPDAGPTLWGWLAKHGGDSALLAHAVMGQDAPLPDAAPADRLTIATRLTDLGLAAPALLWLERGDRLAAADPAERLAAATALMQGRDARTALPLIAGMDGPEAEALRVAALEQLGTQGTLPPEAEERVARRTGDWNTVAAGTNPEWAEAATLLTPPAPQGGPLTRSRAMVDEAAAARARINSLLQGLPAQ